MVSFKGLTKVGLVLALCFTFAGVGNTGNRWTNRCKEAKDKFNFSAKKCAEGIDLERRYRKFGANNPREYPPSKRVSNEVDTKAYCEEMRKDREHALSTCEKEAKFDMNLYHNGRHWIVIEESNLYWNERNLNKNPTDLY